MTFEKPKPEWRTPPDSLALEPDQVDVWRIPGPAGRQRLARMESVLSEDETARAGRYVVTRPREMFVLSRGSLRAILSRYLSCGPREIQFDYGPNGKPSLAGELGGSGLEFNVSHSFHLAIVVVARGRSVGIDVERVRSNIEIEQLARRFFAPAEARRLTEEARPEDRLVSFFRCWTRKEAYLKLRGAGLSFELDRFEVTSLPDEEPRLLRTAIQGDRPADFFVAEIDVDPAYVASLMVPAPEPVLRFWDA